MVAAAIQRNKSTAAAKLAATLRALPHTGPYQGVTGPIAFTLTGDLEDRAFNIITYEPNGKLYIDGYDPSGISNEKHDTSDIKCTHEAGPSERRDDYGKEIRNDAHR